MMLGPLAFIVSMFFFPPQPLLLREKYIDERLCAQYIVQICNALNYMHRYASSSWLLALILFLSSSC